MKISETSQWSGQNLSNSLCQFWMTKVNSSPNFVSLFSFMKGNFYVLFSSNSIYFAQEEPIKVKIFETFECSSQNLSNSLCQFWNDKSIPLQILYPSSVSWKVTPLYFFSSNNTYYAQKEPIKVKFFETFECSIQNFPNSLCQFWNDNRFLSKFCIPIQFHER